MIDALYTATQSPMIMALVSAVFAATATLLAFRGLVERQPLLSWLSIFLYLLTITAVALSLVRTEPDPTTLRGLQVVVRLGYVLMGAAAMALAGWVLVRDRRV